MSNDRISEEFGECLKELRNKKGVSLRKAAAVLGIDNGNLSGIENGRTVRLPTPRLLKKIAMYYYVPIVYLCKKAGYTDLDTKYPYWR